MNRKNFQAVILALLLAGCQARETEIVILSLNDLHAKIDNLDKVAAYVNEERAKNPNVLLLSAGDFFSGNPVVDYHQDKGFPIIDLMNDLRADASALGNHEFDYGQETLAKRIAQAKFPFVCANINTSQSPVPALKPYVFFTKSREKICIVGLTQECPETHASKLVNLSFANPIEEFEKYSPLRKKCGLLIALTHIGVQQDSLLALRYGGLDLIVGGHSHNRLDTGLLVNGVLITQAERYVNYVGKTTVKLRNGKVVSKRNTLVNVAQLTQKDTLVSKKIQEYNNTPELLQVVGTLTQTIAGQFNIGNFLCDAVLAQTQADIAFQNLFGVRSDTLRKGMLTKKELYNADPFGNEIVQVEMTGSEILQLIASVYDTLKRLDLCVSGISYEVRNTTPQTFVQAWLPGGQLLDLRKKYKVVMNSYMATKPNDYALPHDSSIKGLSITTVEAAINYIEQQKVVSFTSPIRVRNQNSAAKH